MPKFQYHIFEFFDSSQGDEKITHTISIPFQYLFICSRIEHVGEINEKLLYIKINYKYNVVHLLMSNNI